MPLFGRSLKPEGGALPVANGDSDAASSPRWTIGDLLRDTRKSYGGDLDHIAASLRIRPSYLIAIEESQYDKLPGPTYAHGFVRAYAVYLRLDGDEAVRRFKQEVAGFEVSHDLSFPVLLAERSVPGGTMVLAALILALCGYGLWYYVSTGDRAHPEKVTAVPPDLVAATKKPAPDVPAAVAGTAPAAAAPAIVPPDVAAAAANTTPSPTPAGAPPATLATAPATSPPPNASGVPALALATPAVVQSGQASAMPASVAPPVAAATVAAPLPGAGLPPAQRASAPAATAVPPPAGAAAASATTQPHVYGAAAGVPARIIIRAIKDSWVQIRNGGEVFVERTLHPGDSVRVPNKGGLALRTGNGAGIQFEIDGKLFKPLSGTVRTVALDPDRLAANNGSPPRTVEFNTGGLPRTAQPRTAQ